MAPTSVNSGSVFGLSSAWVKHGWQKYTATLRARPVATQMATSAVMWSIGDVVAQRVEKSLKHEAPSSSAHEQREIALRRNLANMLFGAVYVGYFGHHWYELLHRAVKCKFQQGSKRFIFSKVAADGLIFSPFGTLVYFVQMGLMRGHSLAHIRQTLRDNFLDTVTVETAYWPLLDAINFKFVPVCHQLLFVNLATIGDNAFLSWVANDQEKGLPWSERLHLVRFPGDPSQCLYGETSENRENLQ